MSVNPMDDLVNEPDPGGIMKDPLDYIDFAARYHGDAEFRSRVDADPAAALRAQGLAIPDDVAVKLVPSDGNVVHIVLPPPTTGRPEPPG